MAPNYDQKSTAEAVGRTAGRFYLRLRPWVCPLVLLIAVAALVSIFWQESAQKAEQEQHAKKAEALTQKLAALESLPSYSELERKDISMPDRSRITARVTYPTVATATAKERSDVAHQAALDIQRETGRDMIEVFLDLSPETSGAMPAIAVARYAPDGKGMTGFDNYHWEVESATGTFTPQQIQMANLFWDAYKKDSAASEPSLIAQIARKLGVPRSKVTWPTYVSSPMYTN
jgi:hypothetical protein